MATKRRAASAVVQMTGPDTRMDEGANPLPVRCPHCTLPDLDSVPRPYLLTRGFAAPAETAPAAVGNFLVRDRVRQILDLALPGVCTFVPTAERKSGKPTSWWLAVPACVADMPGLPDRSKDGQRCARCGEPKLGYHPYAPVEGDPKRVRHVGLDRVERPLADVFKSGPWYAVDTVEQQYAEAVRHTPEGQAPPPWSRFGGRAGVKDPPPHPQRWTRIHIGRGLFFSARLEHLLKAAGVKGQLVRSANFADVEPSAEDRAWAEEQLRRLTTARPRTTGNAAAGVDRWFRQYLRAEGAKREPRGVDFAAVEKRRKVTLPEEYKAFIATVGPASFPDVLGMDGFTAHVLPPEKLDFAGYRRGRWGKLGVESEVDGVVFAATDHGDVFVFDASPEGAGAVYWYDHEQNAVEPFAASFAACVRRFRERN